VDARGVRGFASHACAGQARLDRDRTPHVLPLSREAEGALRDGLRPTFMLGPPYASPDLAPEPRLRRIESEDRNSSNQLTHCGRHTAARARTAVRRLLGQRGRVQCRARCVPRCARAAGVPPCRLTAARSFGTVHSAAASLLARRAPRGPQRRPNLAHPLQLTPAFGGGPKTASQPTSG